LGKNILWISRFFWVYKLCQKYQWNPITHPWKKEFLRPWAILLAVKNHQLSWQTEKKKTTKFKSGFKQIIKTYPKNYVWLAYWKKISNFFRLGTQWPKNYYIFWSKFNPPLLRQKKPSPSNFGTLNPPDLASKSHTNIFLWWPKKEYIFAIAHFSCPQNQKKSLKNPPKKKNSQKTNKNYHLWGRRKKRFCLGQKFKLKWWKKLLLTYSKSTKFFWHFLQELGRIWKPILSLFAHIITLCDLFCC